MIYIYIYILGGGEEGKSRTNKKGSIAAMVEALGLLPLWLKPYHDDDNDNDNDQTVVCL